MWTVKNLNLARTKNVDEYKGNVRQWEWEWPQIFFLSFFFIFFDHSNCCISDIIISEHSDCLSDAISEMTCPTVTGPHCCAFWRQCISSYLTFVVVVLPDPLLLRKLFTISPCLSHYGTPSFSASTSLIPLHLGTKMYAI